MQTNSTYNFTHTAHHSRHAATDKLTQTMRLRDLCYHCYQERASAARCAGQPGHQDKPLRSIGHSTEQLSLANNGTANVLDTTHPMRWSTDTEGPRCDVIGCEPWIALPMYEHVTDMHDGTASCQGLLSVSAKERDQAPPFGGHAGVRRRRDRTSSLYICIYSMRHGDKLE